MSLSPRAAARALRSPPELDQLEYKHDAAYFDQNEYPQYPLRTSSRSSLDQEALLAPSDPQCTTNAASSSSCFSRHVAWLISILLPRSCTAATAPSACSTSSPRKAWLPILLVANLGITVAAFVAACIHFNTLTTLFLYLALLVVAFPILSLSLFLVNSGSKHYQLQLHEFIPNSTPSSEQSSSLFPLWFMRSPSSATSHRRSRSCRTSGIETMARSAQYLFAALWLLAIVEWLCFHPNPPTSATTTRDNVSSFIASSTPIQPLKVFIASNLYNSQEILPTYTASLKSLAQHLGTDNVFVSIYESHSTDRTKSMLAQFDADLAQLNVQRRILSDDRAVRMNKSSPIHDRIEFLANVRNVAMQPLFESANATERYSHVLWINDIVFTPQNALDLLYTNDAHYDQVCAMDFIGNGFYDTWVTRDADGNTLKRQWPYFKRNQDVEALRKNKLFQVNSCWNGITAFDAKWFYPDFSKPPSSNDSRGGAIEDGLVHLPLKFRSSSECLASECQLISYDIHRSLHPARPNILVNPSVKVAYTDRHYFLFNTLVPSPILRPWRIIWRDWIAYRLLGWATENRRWQNECGAKQKWWSHEPADL